MIQFFHVTKQYPGGPGGQLALDDISLKVEREDFIFLTGASGAGKSTLLKMIYRGSVPTSGQIVVNGRNVSSLPRKKVPYLRRTMGVVFQEFRLINRKTVYENVSYLPRILGMGPSERKRLAYMTLKRVGLAHRMFSFPTDLSGGEKQRVAIARALINEPEILIADEPTGNLDPKLSAEILKLFTEINRRGTTVLVATHDTNVIESLGGRVLVLDRGRLAEDKQVEGDRGPMQRSLEIVAASNREDGR